MTQTVYRPVPDYVDLYAGIDGSIVKAGYGELKQIHYPNAKYLQVFVPNGGSKFVHELVAPAYLGERPPGMQIRHSDGNSMNNAAGNFCYGTAHDNTQDAIAHGRHGSLVHKQKTHCAHDHEFTAENTYTPPNTCWRQCRTCRRNNEAKRGTPKVKPITNAGMKRFRIEQRHIKNTLIDELLKTVPKMSDRAIAKQVGVGHPTVARRRKGNK